MKAVDAIEALLDREYALLVQGRLGALARLADYKEALLARLGDDPPPAAQDLEQLRRKAVRNDALLAAAARGAKAALHQVAKARSLGGQLTYLADGRTRKLAAGSSQLERKL